MIGWVRGRGSVVRRLAGEFVPFLVGFGLGSLGAPFLGPWGGLAAGLLTWLGASAILHRVRRTRSSRRVYRALLVVWLVFWAVHGLRDSTPRPRGRRTVVLDPAPRQARPFGAGVGSAHFDLPARTTLAGWGSRPRRRTFPAFGGFGALGRLSLRSMGGVPPRAPMFHLPQGDGELLGARALLLLPEGSPGGALAFVRLDLIVPEHALRQAVLERVPELGIHPSRLLLSANHTHSGPGGYQRSPLAWVVGCDLHDTEVFGAVVDAVASALREASGEARPACIAFPTSRDRGADGTCVLSRNRRHDPQRVDDRVLALRVMERGGDRIIGMLVNYAVQPVLMRREHMAFGRDLAGAIEDALSDVLPGRPSVLFFNGATGDVSPRRTFGKGEEGVRHLAAAFAERVAPDLLRAPAYDRISVRAWAARLDLGSPYAFVALGSRCAFEDQVVPEAMGTDAPSVLTNVLSLPANLLLWGLGLTELRAGFTFEGAVGVLANLERAVTPHDAELGVVLVDGLGESGDPHRAVFLWQGGLPTQELGRQWRSNVEDRGLPTPFLLALTNDARSYLTTEEEFAAGEYEALSTLYGRGAGQLAGAVLATGVDALLEP